MKAPALRWAVSAVTLFCACLAWGAAPTEQDAVRVAKDVVRATQRPLPSTEPRVAQVSGPWGATWRVQFSPLLAVHVSASTGKIVALFDASAMPSETSASAISEQDAHSQAEQQLKAIQALPDDAVFQRVTPLLTQPGRGPAMWQVMWARKCGPYPVPSDKVVAQVDAGTGRLVNFSNNFRTPCPSVLQPTVAHDAALESAQRAVGGSPAEDRPPWLAVVDPDYEAGTKEYGRRSALAWIVTLAGGKQVIVSAEDAKVLGVIGQGAEAFLTGPKGPDLREVLADATRIVVYNHREGFPNPIADVRVSDNLRRALLACVSTKGAVGPENQFCCYNEMRVFAKAGEMAVFGLATDWVRERGPAGRVRFWVTRGLRQLLGLRHETTETWDRHHVCPDLRVLLQKADALKVERFYSGNPRTWRGVTVGLDTGLRKRLSAAISETALLSIICMGDPAERTSIWGWRLSLLRNGRALVDLVCPLSAQDRSSAEVSQARKTMQYGCCHWQVTAKFGDILDRIVAKAPGRRSTSSR